MDYKPKIVLFATHFSKFSLAASRPCFSDVSLLTVCSQLAGSRLSLSDRGRLLGLSTSLSTEAIKALLPRLNLSGEVPTSDEIDHDILIIYILASILQCSCPGVIARSNRNCFYSVSLNPARQY